MDPARIRCICRDGMQRVVYVLHDFPVEREGCKCTDNEQAVACGARSFDVPLSDATNPIPNTNANEFSPLDTT
jgi:hypothetical protein